MLAVMLSTITILGARYVGPRLAGSPLPEMEKTTGIRTRISSVRNVDKELTGVMWNGQLYIVTDERLILWKQKITMINMGIVHNVLCTCRTQNGLRNAGGAEYCTRILVRIFSRGKVDL